MKVLLVSDADSIWTRRFIEFVLLPLKYEIDVLSTQNVVFTDFYKNNGITVHTAYHPNNILYRIPKLRAVMLLAETMRIMKKVPSDILQLNYVPIGVARLLNTSRIKSKLVLAYLGSDLLRSTKEQLLSVKKAVGKADAVVVMTAEMRDRFSEIYGEKLDSKVSTIDMGISAFKYIDQAIDNIEMEKETLLGKEDCGRKVITIGYNASPAQQHEELIQELKKLPDKIKEDIIFIFPMTYPKGKENYIHNIRDSLNKSGLKYRILTEFMDDYQIARLCVSTNIFVNAQTTDALSTSMMEHLYAKTTVLNASWLHYRFLQENGIRYETFDKIENLNQKLECLIASDAPQYLETNQNVMAELCSWENCRENWKNVYDNIN